MAVGPFPLWDDAFQAAANTVENRVAVMDTTQDGFAKLPSGNDPAAPTILGVFRETRLSGQNVGLRRKGIEFVEAGGTCTRGKYARVMADGKVEDVQTNATPALQSYVGVFQESATIGQLARVEIDPGFITQ